MHFILVNKRRQLSQTLSLFLLSSTFYLRNELGSKNDNGWREPEAGGKGRRTLLCFVFGLRGVARARSAPRRAIDRPSGYRLLYCSMTHDDMTTRSATIVQHDDVQPSQLTSFQETSLCQRNKSDALRSGREQKDSVHGNHRPAMPTVVTVTLVSAL